MWSRALPATKEAAKNQNEDISFQSEATEDLLGQENLETIPHDFRVPERPVNNGNKREMSYLSIERLSFSCNPVCVRSSASGENTLFNFFFVFWRWFFYNPAKRHLCHQHVVPRKVQEFFHRIVDYRIVMLQGSADV